MLALFAFTGCGEVREIAEISALASAAAAATALTVVAIHNATERQLQVAAEQGSAGRPSYRNEARRPRG
jgi:hypothetical protein